MGSETMPDSADVNKSITVPQGMVYRVPPGSPTIREVTWREIAIDTSRHNMDLQSDLAGLTAENAELRENNRRLEAALSGVRLQWKLADESWKSMIDSLNTANAALRSSLAQMNVDGYEVEVDARRYRLIRDAEWIRTGVDSTEPNGIRMHMRNGNRQTTIYGNDWQEVTDRAQAWLDRTTLEVKP